MNTTTAANELKNVEADTAAFRTEAREMATAWFFAKIITAIVLIAIANYYLQQHFLG